MRKIQKKRIQTNRLNLRKNLRKKANIQSTNWLANELGYKGGREEYLKRRKEEEELVNKSNELKNKILENSEKWKNENNELLNNELELDIEEREINKMISLEPNDENNSEDDDISDSGDENEDSLELIIEMNSESSLNEINIQKDIQNIQNIQNIENNENSNESIKTNNLKKEGDIINNQDINNINKENLDINKENLDIKENENNKKKNVDEDDEFEKLFSDDDDDDEKDKNVDRAAAFRKILEADKKKIDAAKKLNRNGMVMVEAEEEEEEDAIRGLGDFGFGVPTKKKKDDGKIDDERDDYEEANEDDFENIVDQLSDDEGDEEEGQKFIYQKQSMDEKEELKEMLRMVREGFNNERGNNISTRGEFSIKDLTKRSKNGLREAKRLGLLNDDELDDQNNNKDDDEEFDFEEELTKAQRMRHMDPAKFHMLYNNILGDFGDDEEEEEEEENNNDNNNIDNDNDALDSDEEEERRDRLREKKFKKRAKMRRFLSHIADTALNKTKTKQNPLSSFASIKHIRPRSAASSPIITLSNNNNNNNINDNQIKRTQSLKIEIPKSFQAIGNYTGNGNNSNNNRFKRAKSNTPQSAPILSSTNSFSSFNFLSNSQNSFAPLNSNSSNSEYSPPSLMTSSNNTMKIVSKSQFIFKSDDSSNHMNDNSRGPSPLIKEDSLSSYNIDKNLSTSNSSSTGFSDFKIKRSNSMPSFNNSSSSSYVGGKFWKKMAKNRAHK